MHNTNYADCIESLTFSTIAPGGFGHLTCSLKLPQARLAIAELQPFANVALMDGTFAAFLGRWDEPAITLSETEGDLIQLSAQGGATNLKDDPQDYGYTAQTAQAVISNQISTRSAYIALDTDTSKILPNNPSSVYTLSYSGKTFEDILNDLGAKIGDYQWLVWDHPFHRTQNGFPTWQLQMHVRDTSTVAYQGILLGETSYSIRPSIEYTYNAVTITYKDSTTGLPSTITVQDSRLNSDKSQGTAPFPFRRLRKDLGTLLSSTEAAAVANGLLAQYQNGGYKIEVVLKRALNATGAEIPLWQVRADSNIFLPELSPLGQTLPFSTIVNTNVFYITETSYRETSGQAPTLTVHCNTFYDTAAFQITRLQYRAELLSRSQQSQGVIQAVGSPEIGTVAAAWGSAAITTDTYEAGVNFKATMANIPSSITLTSTSTSNAGTPTTVNITNTGFSFRVQPAANGVGYWRGTYKTNGN